MAVWNKGFVSPGLCSGMSLPSWWNNKASVIKLVNLYSTIKMMHGPINIRLLLHVSVYDHHQGAFTRA